MDHHKKGTRNVMKTGENWNGGMENKLTNERYEWRNRTNRPENYGYYGRGTRELNESTTEEWKNCMGTQENSEEIGQKR